MVDGFKKLLNLVNDNKEQSDVRIVVDYKTGKCSFKVDSDLVRGIRTVFVGFAAMRDELEKRNGKEAAETFDEVVSSFSQSYMNMKRAENGR